MFYLSLVCHPEQTKSAEGSAVKRQMVRLRNYVASLTMTPTVSLCYIKPEFYYIAVFYGVFFAFAS